MSIERQIGAFLNAKLAALRDIGRHLGMFGPLKGNFAEYRRSLIDDWSLLCICAAMLDEKKLPAQRAACGMLLDFFVPGWRVGAPLAALGFVVERDDPEVRRWRRTVLRADGNKCRKCGSSRELHAHHVIRWADAPALRVEPSNGAALCQACHVMEHRGAYVSA